MPRLVAKTLKRVNADLEKMFDTYCSQDDLKGLDLLTPQPLALLYQTGYLTIKSYNSKLKRYRLGIPNREVKDGLYKVLLPYYVQSRSDDEPKRLVGDMVMYFILGDGDGDGIHHLRRPDRYYRQDRRLYLRYRADIRRKRRAGTPSDRREKNTTENIRWMTDRLSV